MGMWNGEAGAALGAGGGVAAGGVAADVPTPPPWQAPSEVERQLYEAKLRGDWAAYFDVLARTDLYHPMPRAWADAHPGKVRFTPYRDPQTGAVCLGVFTPGVLPLPAEDPVYHCQSLGWYAKVWDENDPPWLVVDPGTPCEAHFPTSPGHRVVWRQHAQRVGPHDHHATLNTLWTGGPLHGPVAHGLACGALIQVHNGAYWNAIGWHGSGYGEERRRLAEWWDVSSREDWLRTEERLLDCDMVSPVWSFVLGVRQTLARDFAGPVGVEYWRDATAGALGRRPSEYEITADGVTKSDTRTDAEVEAQIAGTRRLIGRIARYEARFRADGLLPEDGFVRSVDAWDLGRAAPMACWGLGARWCTLEESEQVLLRVGRAARARYRSWEEFSAAYVLGRCLHFDEEEFGHWYEEVLAAHRVLTGDPASPWRNIPFDHP